MFGTADDLQIRLFSAGRFSQHRAAMVEDFTTIKNPAHLLAQADGTSNRLPSERIIAQSWNTVIIPLLGGVCQTIPKGGFLDGKEKAPGRRPDGDQAKDAGRQRPPLSGQDGGRV